VSGQAREGYAGPLQGRGLLARQRRPKGFGGAQASAASPARTSAQRPALIRPDPAPEPVAQGIWPWPAALRAGELAGGGLGTFAAVDWCRHDEREPSAWTIPVDRVDDLEPRRPGTRLVISSGARVLLATIPGNNGIPGTRTSAARTPISYASRSAAGRDHENFATNRSLMTALDECYSGSPCPHFSSSRRFPARSYRRREASCPDPSATGRPNMR